MNSVRTEAHPYMTKTVTKLGCGPMPNVMAPRPNIGGTLFNAAKFGWHPLLECHAEMLARRKTRWNLQGCPELSNRSQLLVDWSLPYYEHMWKRHRVLSRLSIHALVAKIQPTKLCDGAEMEIYLRLVFSASSVQYISDLCCKFALRPHHASALQGGHK